MAGRYTGWYHKRFAPHVPDWLRAAGEVVLGRVSERQQASGLGVIDEFVRLPDGSSIRATIRGAQPMLELIWSGGGEEPDACTLYMESGVLDLGDATEASQYALPTFVDSEKPMAFHSLMGCEELGGLNGEIRYTDRTVSSQCLEKDEAFEHAKCLDPVEAADGMPAISRAMKIDAQGVVPASSFSGLMKKYVQAMYGAPQRAYRRVENTTVLRIFAPGGLYIDAPQGKQGLAGYQYTTGLVDVGNCEYCFVIAPAHNTNSARVRLIEPSFTRCGEKLLRVLKSKVAGKRGDLKFEKLEAYLFTQMFPSNRASNSDLVMGHTAVAAHGWIFHPRLPEARMIAFQGTTELYDRANQPPNASYATRVRVDAVHSLALTVSHLPPGGAKFGASVSASTTDISAAPALGVMANNYQVPSGAIDNIGGLGYVYADTFATGFCIYMINGAPHRARVVIECAKNVTDVPVHSYPTEGGWHTILRSVQEFKDGATPPTIVSGCTTITDPNTANSPRVAYLDVSSGRTGAPKCFSLKTDPYAAASSGSWPGRGSFRTTSLHVSGEWSISGITRVGDYFISAEAGAVTPSRQTREPQPVAPTLTITNTYKTHTQGSCNWSGIDTSVWDSGGEETVDGEKVTQYVTCPVKLEGARPLSTNVTNLTFDPRSAERAYIARASYDVENFERNAAELESALSNSYPPSSAVEEIDLMSHEYMGTLYPPVRGIGGIGYKTCHRSTGYDAMLVTGGELPPVEVIRENSSLSRGGSGDHSGVSCAVYALQLVDIPNAPGAATYYSQSNVPIPTPLLVGDRPWGAATHPRRRTPPLLTSVGGVVVATNDNTFSHEMSNRPISNNAGLPASIKNPSFVGWA